MLDNRRASAYIVHMDTTTHQGPQTTCQALYRDPRHPRGLTECSRPAGHKGAHKDFAAIDRTQRAAHGTGAPRR
jgi:hypothetical protein